MIIVSIEADGLPARRVVVPRLPCRIGRRKDNEIVLDSWRVARVHARIERMERGCRLVDAGALSGTWVNGELKQQGNTRDLINDIPALIEYLSSFMTLLPGDLILTGTPEGVVNVEAGDEVVCEVEGLGRLVNTLVGDDAFSL